jgi:hypothetical protein
MGGGWANARDLTNEDLQVWNSALQVVEPEYNNKNLFALGTPLQVILYNFVYIFLFSFKKLIL